MITPKAVNTVREYELTVSDLVLETMLGLGKNEQISFITNSYDGKLKITTVEKVSD